MAAEAATVAWVDPLPRSDRIALNAHPDGSHSVALELLILASAQRSRLNFGSAKVLYRAARLCVTSAPSEEEATQLLNNMEKYNEDSIIEPHEADSILRMAEMFDEFKDPENPEQFAVRWPQDAPAPPLRRGRCFAAAAAATVGEADCQRILGNYAEAAQLLEKLRFVDPLMAAHAAAEAKKAAERAAAKRGVAASGADTAETTPDAGSPSKQQPASSTDPCGVDGYGEGPRALQVFLLELCGGIGGTDAFGKARIDRLLQCAEEMASAPYAPEIVWRAMGVSCDQRPQVSDAENQDRLHAAEGATGESDLPDDGTGDLPLEWPVDDALSITALAKYSNCEALVDVAVSAAHDFPWCFLPKPTLTHNRPQGT